MTNPKSSLWLSTFGALLLATLLTACNFSVSTANLSSLKLGKDKDVTTEATSFAPQDTVYAIAVVSNNPGKVTVKFEFYLEKVEGQQDNMHVPGGDVSVDLPGSGTDDYKLSPPQGGWDKGTYRLEAKMLNENGEQKDMKKATFTVGG